MSPSLFVPIGLIGFVFFVVRTVAWILLEPFWPKLLRLPKKPKKDRLMPKGVSSPTKILLEMIIQDMLKLEFEGDFTYNRTINGKDYSFTLGREHNKAKHVFEFTPPEYVIVNRQIVHLSIEERNFFHKELKKIKPLWDRREELKKEEVRQEAALRAIELWVKPSKG